MYLRIAYPPTHFLWDCQILDVSIGEALKTVVSNIHETLCRKSAMMVALQRSTNGAVNYRCSWKDILVTPVLMFKIRR